MLMTTGKKTSLAMRNVKMMASAARTDKAMLRTSTGMLKRGGGIPSG